MILSSSAAPQSVICPRRRHACVLAPRAGCGMQRRRRGSVRPEQPERTATMSFSTGPSESHRNRNRAPSSRPDTDTAEPDRHQLRPPAAGCPGEREGWWHRRTLFWRTSCGVQVVSPRVGGRLVQGVLGFSWRLGPTSAGTRWVRVTGRVRWRILLLVGSTDGV